MANNVPLPPPPPPPPPAPSVPRAAYVEEFNEEDQASRPETRQTANISTKRSKADAANVKVGREEFSDSGYSSRTAATPGSSAPSSLESKTWSNPAQNQENTATSKRKPVGLEKVVKNKSQSPEKTQAPKAQSKSKKEKHPEAAQHQETKPKSKSKQLLGGLFQSSKPTPARASQDAPNSLPVRPRTATSQPERKERPRSFHDSTGPAYMTAPIIITRQPTYPQPPIFSSPSYPPPPASYFPPPQQIPPYYDIYSPSPPQPPPSRPLSRQWGYGQHVSTRPHSMYQTIPPQPLVEYGEGPIYTTVAPGVRPPSRQQLPRHRVSLEKNAAHLDDSSRMPPPPPKVPTKSQAEPRPSMVRHAHTISDAYPPGKSQRSGLESHPKARSSDQSPIKQTFTEHERSRRPTEGHAKRSDDSVPSVSSIERGTSIRDKMVKQKRRASLYSHVPSRDLKGSVEAAEAYQASQKSAANPNALSIDTLARRKKIPGTSSDTSSRQSGKSGKSKHSREGSDIRSRRPSSEVKNRNDNDGLAMRFNAAQGVNIQMKGGIEGRTISLRQSGEGEGEMELGIGSRGRAIGSRTSHSSGEKSRRRYSYIEGQSVKEVERSSTSSRPPKSSIYRDERDLPQLGRVATGSSFAESILEEQPLMIRERITTRSRSRRSSRSGYSGWGRAE